MKYVAVLVTAALLALPVSALAQGPTSTPTTTPTPTMSSSTLGGLNTIVPPPQCGTVFTPCGQQPFPYLQFPTLALPSPTLINPVQGNASVLTATPVASPSHTPTPTGTWSSPTPTPPEGMDLGPMSTLSSGISGISSTLVAQSTLSIVVSGTPQNIDGISGELSTNVPNLFGTIRGIAGAARSGTFSIIAFLFMAMLFVILVYFATAFLPILLSLVRLVLSVIQAFKPF